MRFLSLFAGIGGIDAGLEAAGFECAGQVEIDPFCNLVLERHWPNVQRWLDVHDVSAESVRERCGHIDLIAGGFPCQPHSVAGKRKGQSDERHLWPEFSRLVRTIRPTWVLAENVPGIRSTAADEVIGDLEAEGYAVWPLVVGADDVGAPHRRKRAWFVAHRDGAGLHRERGGGLLDGERAASGHDADGCGEDVAYRTSGGQRERGHEPQARCPWDSQLRRESGSDSRSCAADVDAPSATHWPSRPGEPQYEWEEPRLAAFSVGGATDGLSLRLVRRANREALKAYGNAVVPQVVYVIALAIDAVERRQA